MNIEQLKELIDSYNTPANEYHSITLFHDFSGDIKNSDDEIVENIASLSHLEKLIEERVEGKKTSDIANILREAADKIERL
jgi:hypothetical protein